jgi:TrmH family RNA methyltransferase
VTCLDGATSLYEARWQGPLAWIFGAEGLGVRRELIAAASLRIRIPMPGAVESLNVGAAAAVCLFEALRRRLVA